MNEGREMKDVEAILRSKRVELNHQGKEGHLLSVKLVDWMLEKLSCKTSVSIQSFDSCKSSQTPKACVFQLHQFTSSCIL